MTTNRSPTADELNDVKQDTVQWPAKANRSTLTDSDGGEITPTNPLPVSSVAHTSKDVEGNGVQTVGTTPVEIVFTGTTESILISAGDLNLGRVYIGKADVTSAGANAVTYLAAGESFTVNYDDTTNPFYIVGSIADQEYVVGATK